MADKSSRRSISAWKWNEQEDLVRRVRSAYQDLRRPRRGFVSTAFRERPYQDLVSELEIALGTEVVDDTDINSDVCFSFQIGSGGPILLRLSMVGPYAMVQVDRGSGEAGIIASLADCRSDLERSLVTVLTRHGILLLSPDRLAAGIDLALPGIGAATVYNALFCPEDDFTRFAEG